MPLQELSLEIARVARKESNSGLAGRLLVRSLTGRPPPPGLPLEEWVRYGHHLSLDTIYQDDSPMTSFPRGYDFFQQGLTIDRAVALRQVEQGWPSPLEEVSVRSTALLVDWGPHAFHRE